VADLSRKKWWTSPEYGNQFVSVYKNFQFLVDMYGHDVGMQHGLDCGTFRLNGAHGKPGCQLSICSTRQQTIFTVDLFGSFSCGGCEQTPLGRRVE